MKYRKKPVEVNAFLWEVKNETPNDAVHLLLPDWFVKYADWWVYVSPENPQYLFLEYKVGRKTHYVAPGEYILQNPDYPEDIYPCPRKTFLATYEGV